MSYDLAVWEGPRPTSNEAALGVYKQLMDWVVGLQEPLAPTPAIASYVQALLDRWPDLTADAVEESPWSDGPLIANASGNLFYFGMVFSKADEASEYAAQLASEHGLVCFDPQLGALRPIDEADGAPADVSLEAVTCAACGQMIDASEPRAQTATRAGVQHLECLLRSLSSESQLPAKRRQPSVS